MTLFLKEEYFERLGKTKDRMQTVGIATTVRWPGSCIQGTIHR